MKTAMHLLKTTQKYCACHAQQLSTRHKTCWNVTKCHACHAKRGYATSETSKSDHCCKTRHRHGHTALTLTRTVANGCGRLPTVANVIATSSEHTLNPQTPRVKREPLLRIRENLRAVSDIFCGQKALSEDAAQTAGRSLSPRNSEAQRWFLQLFDQHWSAICWD